MEKSAAIERKYESFSYIPYFEKLSDYPSEQDRDLIVNGKQWYQ